ncbi:ankyrin repeat-containing domain protein [Chlamydoabsidia padenii]|nr:ankyrin repeat-containing domain protein [Chlamydoabsidia padenii]
MTKANRRSLRSTSTPVINTTTSPIKKPASQRSSIKKMTEKKPAKSIRDFKQLNGKTLYLVQRGELEQHEDTWETEDMIESLDILTTFNERVFTSTGYSTNGTNNISEASTSTTGEFNAIDSTVNKVDVTTRRPGRTSKTRAMLRLMEPTTTTTEASTWILDSDDSDSEPRYMKKRKRSGASTNKKKTTSLTARGKALIKLQLDLIKQRKNDRALWLDTHPWQDHDHSSVETISCCLRCSIKAYRQAIINNDLPQLKTLLEQTKTYPSWTLEDRGVLEDNVLKLALSLGNSTVVELLKEDKKVKRIQLSKSITTYGSNTGYVSRYTFGHAVKQVNESRGNRQGNSAFYRTASYEDFNLDYKCHPDNMDEYLSLLHSPLIEQSSVINCLHQFGTGGDFVYHVVASGNINLSVKLMDDVKEASGYNMLHHAVLLNQDLPSHRKNQILKKATYTYNISPFLCAAINPSASHLTRLFEQLDAAERVETDDLVRTVAHYAAASSTPDCLEYLISQNYNFSQGDKYRLTPLVQAARFGRYKNIRPLLKYLSNDHFPCTEFADHTLLRNRRRPLHYAAAFGHAEACKELIDCGATVDAVESTQKATPLILASHRGHLDCVKTLVEHGCAGLHLVDKFTRSPLHLACMTGHYEVAKYLLVQGLDADAHDSSNNTPAHYACAFGHMEVLKLLVEFGSADPSSNNVWRSTPCSVANLKGHIAIVQYLLSLPGGRVNVDFKDQDGFTMLHHAVVEKVTNTSEIDQNLRRIQVLLDKNANVNAATIDGNTVLHSLMMANYYNKHLLKRSKTSGFLADDQVCIEYQQRVVRLILDAGADINAVNVSKNTPLALAMASQNFHMVALLIEQGAKYWSDVDNNGNTFFHGLLYGTAQLDNVRLDEKGEITWDKLDIIQSRYVESISSIWDTIQANPVPADQVGEIKINHVNNQGYTALLYGILEAIKMQKEYIAKEKEIVKESSSSRYHHRLTTEDTATEIRRPMRFVFKFDHFFIYAKKLLDHFKPDINVVVKLPKGYLKKNPKAKPDDYPRETGCSVLQLVAYTQHVPLLDFLLSHGADPNQQAQKTIHGSGMPPLVYCYFTRWNDSSLYLSGNTTIAQERIHKLFDIVMPSFENDRYDSLDIFIKYGANPCLPDGKGTSALMKAAMALDGKAVQIMCNSLIQSYGDFGGINNCDASNATALMIAFSAYETEYKAANDKEKVDTTAVTHLLSAGANVNATFENGDTVLMKILRLGYYPLVESLLQLSQTPLNHMATNEDGETPLIVVCKMGSPMALKIYLARLGNDFTVNSSVDIKNCVNAMDHQHNTPLSLTASKGALDGARTLLEYQADPNNATGDKNPLFEAIKSKSIDVVEALLCAGANPDAQESGTGSSALHYAVKSEKIALVRLLLKQKASPNLVDKMYQTPLHWAIQLSKNQTNRSMRVERLLLQAGANINAKDIFDRTPLHIIFTGLHVVPRMKTTDLTYKKVKALIAEQTLAKLEENTIKQYVEKYGQVNDDLDAWLEQHKRMAVEQEKLLKACETKNNSEDDEATKLTDHDRVTLVKYLDYTFEQDSQIAPFDPVDMLKDLVDTPGIELDLMDSFGRTPLHYAVIVDAISCVNMMLDSGKIDVNTKDYDTNGGVQLALRYGHSNMAVMIHNRGGNDSDIVFPDGHKDSAISYSLSHSYMNVSYLFMSNTETVLNSLSDSLIKGKFHFAHTLLRNASDLVLKGTIAQTNQNLWHVISNFTPFDVDMWNDYLPDFLERLELLDLEFTLDKNNCSPLYYAALNGQETMVKHLLTLDPRPQCTYDATHSQSQVWAAVFSNNINCVKMLLDAGLPLTAGSHKTKPSVLLQAIYNDNLEMVKLLLQHGADLDTDSDYGRQNSVMAACVKERADILQVLVNAGANVDKSSCITRRKRGKLYSTITSPIFVGSIHKSNEILKILLNASANTNVIGPKDQNVEDGRSCLMFNICNDRTDNVKLLLEHGANVDTKDDHSNRSAFYSIFFEKETLSYKDAIYEMMIKHSPGPNVNIVDEETGMVPLEVAIRNHDIALVDRLLALGANPNIKSCKKKIEPTDLYNDTVNAIFHCVLNDDLYILKTVCEATQHDIDWTTVDSNGRTIFSRVVNINDNYGYKNTSILDYLVGHIGESLYKKVVEIPDHSENRPTHVALLQNRKDHYDALIRYGAQPVLMDTEMNDNDNTFDDRMDVEQIPLETVEKDAETERVALQKLLESRKKKTTAQPTTEDNKAVIDPYSKLEKIGTMVFDQGEPYDIMIMKVEVASYLHSSNMFYKMSVIYNKLLDLYVLWTRWGAFGDVEGMHQKTPYLTQEEAVTEFKSIFKSKTGNNWEDHRDNFVEKPGRYQLIKARDPIKDAILDNVNLNFIHNEIQPTQLPNNLHNTMKLFCNFKTLKNAYKNIKLDIPIGQVPPDSLREATAILGRLRTIVDKLKEYNHHQGNSEQRARRKELIHIAIQESSRYYRLMPTYNPNDKRGLQPILTDNALVKENSRLNDARYINFTLNVVLAAKHRAKEINPFDYSYRSLGCQLAEINPDSREFNVVSKYMSSTSNDSGYEIAHLFSVDRDQEKERFKPFATEPNRKLLWHGSQLGNFMGILNQGLRSKPSTANESGSLFGNGIYFADMFCKSVHFATNIYGNNNPAYGLLLLCEVALGDECPLTPNTFYKYTQYKEDKGYTSIKGVGKEGPNLSNSIYDINGVMIPMGPSVKLESPETETTFYDSRTTYNEYIVHDEARVKIRYMVLVRHNDYCFLCQSRTTRKCLESLKDQKLESVAWDKVNSFEQQIFDMYLQDIGKTPKQFFDEKLPDFLKNQNSNKALQDWSLPLDIEATSQVCGRCASKMVTMMLTEELQQLQQTYSNTDNNKYPFFNLVNCRDGRQCKLQHTSLSHAKLYQHWTPKPSGIKDNNNGNEINNYTMEIDSGDESYHEDDTDDGTDNESDENDATDDDEDSGDDST